MACAMHQLSMVTGWTFYFVPGGDSGRSNHAKPIFRRMWLVLSPPGAS